MDSFRANSRGASKSGPRVISLTQKGMCPKQAGILHAAGYCACDCFAAKSFDLGGTVQKVESSMSDRMRRLDSGCVCTVESIATHGPERMIGNVTGSQNWPHIEQPFV